MAQKVKILSKYSIDAIDYDYEKNKAEATLVDKMKFRGIDLEKVKKINSKKKKTADEEKILAATVEIENEYSTRMEEINSYKELVMTSMPSVSDTDQVVPYYEEQDGKIVMLWEVRENDPFRVTDKIAKLKKELADSDYKIIKCYEASLSQTFEMPYDIQTLITERQALRDEINSLEKIIGNNEVKSIKVQ